MTWWHTEPTAFSRDLPKEALQLGLTISLGLTHTVDVGP